jgi:uncharacterized membrane protein HdeD (DUF308 family)
MRMQYIDPKSIINRTWWLLMLEGLLAAAFGLGMLYDPGAPFARLSLIVAAFWMLGGLADMFGGLFKYGADPDWWVGFVTGLLGIIGGAILFAHAAALQGGPPIVGGRALPAPIALGVGLTVACAGLFNFVAAIRQRSLIDAEGAITLWGLIQLAVGAWFASTPLFAEVLTLIAIVATFSIIGGIALTVFGFRMKWFRGDSGTSAPLSGGSRRREY